MGFFRQEDWSGLPCLPPGDRPYPGIEPVSLMSPELSGRFFTTSATWEAQNWLDFSLNHLLYDTGEITKALCASLISFKKQS